MVHDIVTIVALSSIHVFVVVVVHHNFRPMASSFRSTLFSNTFPAVAITFLTHAILALITVAFASIVTIPNVFFESHLNEFKHVMSTTKRCLN